MTQIWAPIQVAIGNGINPGRQHILAVSRLVQLPIDQLGVVVIKFDVLKEGLKRLAATAAGWLEGCRPGPESLQQGKGCGLLPRFGFSILARC